MKCYPDKTPIKFIEEAFPHFVEMALPDGGLGKKLDTVIQWHRARGLDAISGRRDENGRHYIRWCFADPGVAVVFADEFDGTIGQQDNK